MTSPSSTTLSRTTVTDSAAPDVAPNDAARQEAGSLPADAGAAAASGAELNLAMEFADVAMCIAEAPDLASTRQQIVQLAVAKLGCHCASLWHLPERATHLRLDACSDAGLGEGLAEIAASQAILAEECLRTGGNLVVDDFAAETRWPGYSRHMMDRTPVRSAAAFCLGTQGDPVGVLVLYADRPYALTMQRLALGSVYAVHAAVALHDASRSDQADNLSKALESNRRIGVAIGVLVAIYKVTEEQAFELLRTASQRNHVKLADVAEEVVLTGAAPSWPESRHTGEQAHRP
ncbi:MAG TPA: GAF and ANTAR domain-containing protein [Jatrophihabitans sp.]|nr:GAF and ANTAR domain-containing protein [Jatrophihabitans sp.]